MNNARHSRAPRFGTYILSDCPHLAMLVLKHEGVRGFVRKLSRLVARRLPARRPASASPTTQPTQAPRAPVEASQTPLRVDDRLRVVYVTEATTISGGHRQIFEQLNRLAARGHRAELYSLGPLPDWFDLRVPVRTFGTYDALVHALAKDDGVKVATWWRTAEHVLCAARTRGKSVYLVQDFETSYYKHDRQMQKAVLASYHPAFSYVTESAWIRARLREVGRDAALIPPGIDLATYRPLGFERRPDVVLTAGRSHYLKNLTLSWLAWRRLPKPRPELWMFGIEPDLAVKFGARYFTNPTDEEVNELLNTATVFLQTSKHEGFGLPILEAMAAGTPVVCTDAHGNRDFCFDGVNCLMPGPRSDEVAKCLEKAFDDNDLRQELRAEGLATAGRFDWERQITQLETFLKHVLARPAASPGLGSLSTASVANPRR